MTAGCSRKSFKFQGFTFQDASATMFGEILE
jgi:hypothetical protein